MDKENLLVKFLNRKTEKNYSRIDPNINHDNKYLDTYFNKNKMALNNHFSLKNTQNNEKKENYCRENRIKLMPRKQETNKIQIEKEDSVESHESQSIITGFENQITYSDNFGDSNEIEFNWIFKFKKIEFFIQFQMAQTENNLMSQNLSSKTYNSKMMSKLHLIKNMKYCLFNKKIYDMHFNRGKRKKRQNQNVVSMEFA